MIRTRRNNIKEILLTYIKNHVKEFIIMTIIFFIGLIFGVIFINYLNEQQQKDTSSYISNFIMEIQQNKTINKTNLLKESVTNNMKTVLIMWFIGCTLIGIPILYGFIAFKGFCLGYTVSAIFATLQIKNGLIFSLTSMFFQNTIFIPALIALAVSGMQVYKSIIKDKERMNIKNELYRHTIFSCIIGIIFIASSFVEVYLSANLFLICVNWL